HEAPDVQMLPRHAPCWRCLATPTVGDEPDGAEWITTDSRTSIRPSGNLRRGWALTSSGRRRFQVALITYLRLTLRELISTPGMAGDRRRTPVSACDSST